MEQRNARNLQHVVEWLLVVGESSLDRFASQSERSTISSRNCWSPVRKGDQRLLEPPFVGLPWFVSSSVTALAAAGLPRSRLARSCPRCRDVLTASSTVRHSARSG